MRDLFTMGSGNRGFNVLRCRVDVEGLNLKTVTMYNENDFLAMMEFTYKKDRVKFIAVDRYVGEKYVEKIKYTAVTDDDFCYICEGNFEEIGRRRYYD